MKHRCEKCGYIGVSETFGDGCPACEAAIPTVWVDTRLETLGELSRFGGWRTYHFYGSIDLLPKFPRSEGWRRIKTGEEPYSQAWVNYEGLQIAFYNEGDFVCIRHSNFDLFMKEQFAAEEFYR